MDTEKLSFKSAAKKVLDRTTEPMSAAEITRIAIDEEMLESSGRTPDATMAAQIYTDILKDKNSPFIKVGRGLFSLRSKTALINTPAYIIENQNELTKAKLKSILHSLDPFQFEFLVGDLLQKIGYENVTVTKRSGDKGIDIIANLTVGGITNVKTAIQVKRYAVSNKVTGATVAQLRGSAEVDQRGLVITTSDFTKDAIIESQAQNKMPVSLVNGDKLISLLIKYEVGIKKEELFILSIDEAYFQNYTSETSKLSDSGKSRSIWPLPGGVSNYLETLNLFMEQILKLNNSKKGLSKWYLSNFDSVKSENTTLSYINVPRNLGLTSYENDIYSLTTDGHKYYESKDKGFLYEVISKNIVAFDDIYEYLKNSPNPVSENEILEFVNENFDVDWTTFAQVTFRLLWLTNLHKVAKTSSGYIAK